MNGVKNGTIWSYTTGFVLSVLFTIDAYILVSRHLFSNRGLVISIASLAFAQFVVQLLFFLHLGTETKPRWKLLAFLFMILVVMILVFGSIWIMNHLNYHMSPDQMNTYMQNQNSL